MTSEEVLVLNVWEMVKDVLPNKHRADKACEVLRMFIESEIITDFRGLEGEDDHLDTAIAMLTEEEEEGDEYY